MKRALVYLEGPSDKAAMEALFKPLIATKYAEGASITFHASREGHGKKNVVLHVPRKAAEFVLNNPHAVVAAVPDLYPPNQGFPHRTAGELQEGMVALFKRHCDRMRPKQWNEYRDRFRVFCFKHDFEALLLACPDALRAHLGLERLDTAWTLPVEDQNHGHPPKRIVEELFEKCGRRYQGVADAPMILHGQNPRTLAEACPQCFKPFVDFLETL
ncbi:hypothetical protein NNJEOMEG_01160 [Fundidesulfovibrio magnetotacticus]|uniref:DUF4276 family protein n=1 Tax=Fundidesulfovibrio magnetotacticus TaxID=2730080 RepID=A0A6V8LSN5_9BACT|nr:DUF4276 family protein [Fundidesulfovibrio magnetotacticus]GFK93328.1 hypothetical protein NNJEOMEG_01160 [Fundidesulfovibrio magnetotacticus]